MSMATAARGFELVIRCDHCQETSGWAPLAGTTEDFSPEVYVCLSCSVGRLAVGRRDRPAGRGRVAIPAARVGGR
ncbi:MAG: hypothetical protein L0216_07900 [Planctomycetales bacterium]|nr:hypothetical protein [Planctomycetales bacterium]